MEPVNPYRPSTETEAVSIQAPSGLFFASLIPATLTVGLTLIFWVVLVSAVDVPRLDDWSIFVWSLTLLLSSSVAIVAMRRLWRSEIQPLAIFVAYTVFCMIFLFAEGDTSNGANVINQWIVYGTLLGLPVFAYFLARNSRRRIQVDGDSDRHG